MSDFITITGGPMSRKLFLVTGDLSDLDMWLYEGPADANYRKLQDEFYEQGIHTRPSLHQAMFLQWLVDNKDFVKILDEQWEKW